MLEVRKNTFSRSYENSFFREFSRQLFNSFNAKHISGVLIGSPVCDVDERLQIDALLITPSVVCIIDFKNFKGKIKLPPRANFEFGLWTNEEGDQIKGGSTINPFIQLKNQKRRFIDVFDKCIKQQLNSQDVFNPFHVVRIVCFQNEVELLGNVPSHESLNFFIFNKINFNEGILDVIDVKDKEVNLSENSYDILKHIFRADPYKFDNRIEEVYKIDEVGESNRLNYDTLHNDQKDALSFIKSFLESKNEQVFILQGTINSGKSFLIPFIQELAYASSIPETEIFATSGRIAKNLMVSADIDKVNSIYSYIYGGKRLDLKIDDKLLDDFPDESSANEISSDISLDVIPLKKCDNSPNALFIVDEAQLVSNSFHQSLDLLFGSGCLLSDFLSFAEISATQRKVIFIGDPYQIQLGKSGETPLNPNFLESNFNLKVSCFQLMDQDDVSEINMQALSCVRSIRSGFYNSLHFKFDTNFTLLKAQEELFDFYKSSLLKESDKQILTYSNEESQKVNQWIKRTIIKSGDDLAPGDLIFFNNNISVVDVKDPFAGQRKVYNGQFAKVVSIASEYLIEENLKVKGELTSLKFRELSLVINDTGHQFTVLSFENYRLNPKSALTKNELILYKVLLNTELARARSNFVDSYEFSLLKQNQSFIDFGGENNELISQLINGTSRRKDLNQEEQFIKETINEAKRTFRNRIENNLRQDSTSKYFKLKNAAHLHYGWAMTVHKAMSYKWKEVIFNVDPGELLGKNSESYFRWLYTGISRSVKSIALVNYVSLSPFDKTEFKDCHVALQPPDIIFHSNSVDSDIRLDEFKTFITSKVADKNYTISNIEHLSWQERYFISDENDLNQTTLSFTYNNNGNFKISSFKGGDTNFSSEILTLLKQRNPITSFDGICDFWRQLIYSRLCNDLSSYGIHFELIIQTKFKDKLRLYSSDHELHIDLDYSGDGLISFISAKYYNDPLIWNNFIKTVEKIRNDI